MPALGTLTVSSVRHGGLRLSLFPPGLKSEIDSLRSIAIFLLMELHPLMNARQEPAELWAHVSSSRERAAVWASEDTPNRR
jgi:hypothetical protein